MSDVFVLATDSREKPRRRWPAHAGAAFELMVHLDHPIDLVAFDQLDAGWDAIGRPG